MAAVLGSEDSSGTELLSIASGLDDQEPQEVLWRVRGIAGPVSTPSSDLQPLTVAHTGCLTGLSQSDDLTV